MEYWNIGILELWKGGSVDLGIEGFWGLRDLGIKEFGVMEKLRLEKWNDGILESSKSEGWRRYD